MNRKSCIVKSRNIAFCGVNTQVHEVTSPVEGMMTNSTSQFFQLAPTCSAHARLEEAEHYFLLGNLDEALATAQQAWREHPQEPDVFRVLAYLHMSRGEYQPAEQAARVAVQLDGMHAASHATLAQVYLTFNVQQMARQTLDAAQQQFPHDAALLVLSADLHFRQRHDLDGVAMATRALEYSSRNGYAQALLGAYYLRQQNFRCAADFLTGAVEGYPLRWDYQRDLGIALLHEQQYRDACTRLLSALQLHPHDESLQHYLWYALHFDESPATWYWQNSFFFYRHYGLGILLHIIGYPAGLCGLLWCIALVSTGTYSSSSLPWALFFLLGGAVLLFIANSGTSMRRRKGVKFEHALNQAIEQANLRWQTPGDSEQ